MLFFSWISNFHVVNDTLQTNHITLIEFCPVVTEDMILESNCIKNSKKMSKKGNNSNMGEQIFTKI